MIDRVTWARDSQEPFSINVKPSSEYTEPVAAGYARLTPEEASKCTSSTIFYMKLPSTMMSLTAINARYRKLAVGEISRNKQEDLKVFKEASQAGEDQYKEYTKDIRQLLYEASQTAQSK